MVETSKSSADREGGGGRERGREGRKISINFLLCQSNPEIFTYYDNL